MGIGGVEDTLRFHPARVEETSDWVTDEFVVGVSVAGTDVRREVAGLAIAPVHYRSCPAMASAVGDTV